MINNAGMPHVVSLEASAVRQGCYVAMGVAWENAFAAAAGTEYLSGC